MKYAVGFVIISMWGSVSAGPPRKVVICHIPPGNPSNFHDISVSSKAVPAHLAHGDHEGSCTENCEALCTDNDPCTIDYDKEATTCVCSTADHREPLDCNGGQCDPETGGCIDPVCEVLGGKDECTGNCEDTVSGPSYTDENDDAACLDFCTTNRAEHGPGCCETTTIGTGKGGDNCVFRYGSGFSVNCP
jgi:hypothetical protein